MAKLVKMTLNKSDLIRQTAVPYTKKQARTKSIIKKVFGLAVSLKGKLTTFFVNDFPHIHTLPVGR